MLARIKMVNFQFLQNKKVAVGNLGRGHFNENKHKVRKCKAGWSPLPVKVGGDGGYTTTRCYSANGHLTRQFRENGHVWFFEHPKENQRFSGGYGLNRGADNVLREASYNEWRETAHMNPNTTPSHRLISIGVPYYHNNNMGNNQAGNNQAIPAGNANGNANHAPHVPGIGELPIGHEHLGEEQEGVGHIPEQHLAPHPIGAPGAGVVPVVHPLVAPPQQLRRSTRNRPPVDYNLLNTGRRR